MTSTIRIRPTLPAATFSLFLLLTAGPLAAQTRATARAEAQIVEGISVEKVSDLEFGTMIASAEGGCVTIDANSGEVSCTGVRHAQSGSCRIAQFAAAGEARYQFAIDVPEVVRLEQTNGKGRLIVTDFRYSAEAGSINEKGTQTFNIGATLHVEPNQPTGTYQGTFEVSIQHQ